MSQSGRTKGASSLIAVMLGASLAQACGEARWCSSCGQPAGGTAAGELDREPADPSPTAQDQREDCRFKAGALPKETLAPGAPLGTGIPIDHFVVIMQENRSFDHYFEMLPERGQPDADVAPKDFSNPDPDHGGTPVTIFPNREYCVADIKHGWNRMHKQYADGAMSGFVASANPHGSRAMGYYDEGDLPYYYALANTFAIGDRYFSEVLGPTYPNRMLAQSASSFGMISDAATASNAGVGTIYTQLQHARLSWSIYSDQVTLEELLFPTLRSEHGKHFASMGDFFKDARAGTLPAFAWVESKLLENALGDDEHPPADIQMGQRFVAKVVDAVMRSPSWPRSAVFMTYDEHGGFFDHVPPPPACAPDAAEPRLSMTDVPGRFDRYGMRVPFIVISPFSKPHFVSHEILSHASILRLVQARFGLPALSARDANSTPPYDLFDFQQSAFLTPPVLPDATVEQTELARCKQLYP